MRGPQREVLRKDVLATMQERDDPREPWTVGELADEMGYAETPIYSRLRELKTQGKVRTKKTGASSRVWWPVEPQLVPREPPDA